jgi:membrane protease YdiL (CAAX protease family)
MRSLLRFGCISLLLAVGSYAAIFVAGSKGAWPTSSQFIAVIAMYGFTTLGLILVFTAGALKLFRLLRTDRKLPRCIERQVPIHAVSSHEWDIRAKREPLSCPRPVALKSTNHGK